MPDGYKYLVEEINRKLSLAKIASNHKGKELIDEVLDEDLPKLVNEWKYEIRRLRKWRIY